MMETAHLPLQAATYEVGDMIKDALNRFLELENQLHTSLATNPISDEKRSWGWWFKSQSSTEPQDPITHDRAKNDLRLWVAGLRDCIVGTVHWLYETDMFFGDSGMHVREYGWIFLKPSQADSESGGTFRDSFIGTYVLRITSKFTHRLAIDGAAPMTTPLILLANMCFLSRVSQYNKCGLFLTYIMSVRPTPNPKGSGYCDICSYDPVLNIPQDIIDAEPNAFTWYTETTAGAFSVSFGAHSGKLLREVPECYLVWTQMVAGNVRVRTNQ